MSSAYAMSNVGTFLELGVISIQYGTNARRMTFLHHIINLPSTDLVYVQYHNQYYYLIRKLGQRK